MNNNMAMDNNYTPPVKLKKTIDENIHHDMYCFQCHHEGDVISCDTCPRVYHPKCTGLIALCDNDWTCPECEITQSSYNIINQSMQRYSVNEFHKMLRYALRRMKSHPQAEYFIRPIESKQMSQYLDYIIHPMDFATIEKNISLKIYNSTEAFIGDIKWILHNTIVFNGNQSKLTGIARALFRIACHEMTEINICPECYLCSVEPVSTDWFTKPCAIPHTLCWAKMKSYQPWPAKVLRVVNDVVDVRFFGQHDRAWLPLNSCFVLSKKYPGVDKKKSNISFEKSLSELQTHIDQLKKNYGHFTYAPLQTSISKTKPFKFVSVINDSILPSYVTVTSSSLTLRSSMKYSKQQRFSTQNQSNKNITKTTKRRYSHKHHRSSKRTRVSSEHIDENRTVHNDNESPTTPNVFDIFNQTDQISSSTKTNTEVPSISFKLRPSSPFDNKLRIQALLRKYFDRTPPIIDPITTDVRLSMNALLDGVEAIKVISEVHTSVTIPSIDNQIPVQQQYIRIKKPRKSRLQHRIITKETTPHLFTGPSLDQSLSSTLPTIPIRPMSVSPTRTDSFESIPSITIDDISIQQQHQELERRISIETLYVKPERINNEVYQVKQPLISTKSFLISPPINSNDRKATNTKHKRSGSLVLSPTIQHNLFAVNSPSPKRSKVKQIPEDSNQPSSETNPATDEIQMIINNFKDQFQQLLVDFTGQIESSLETNRVNYEKDLEETRHSYRLSLNDLHAITAKQIQEMHNNLELQHCKRLSDMRNRFESTLQYQ